MKQESNDDTQTQNEDFEARRFQAWPRSIMHWVWDLQGLNRFA